MATKAEQFRAETQLEQSARKPKKRASTRARTRPIEKPHNLGERAGRIATVAYETSTGRPSRKSTRRSEHRQRPANALERTIKLSGKAPKERASSARVRTIKPRGKPTRSG
ncbi:MAG: hypothetical protein ACOY0T_06730 [Myxococcota bacterium]